MPSPLVTVAMPVLDCEATLAPAIRSIAAQSFERWRLLIVDDGSHDATLEIANSFAERDRRIEVLSDGSHRGLPSRLNECLSLTDTPYFARMDGDDVSYPDRFSRQVDLLSDDHIDLVGSSILVFRSDGRPVGRRPVPATHAEICAHPRSGFPLPHPTWLGRHDWFQRFGGYDERATRCEDQDLLYRAWRTSCFANVIDVLLAYREDRLKLRNSAIARRHYVRSIVRNSDDREQINAVLSAIEQGSKLAAEVLAAVTGWKSFILGHRARPLLPTDDDSWRRVWDATRSTSGSSPTMGSSSDVP